jgi:hypothetical protein
MKKINKIATQDAMRLVEADKFVTDVIIRANTDPKYNDALEKAYRNIQANQTSVAIAQSSSRVITLKRVGIVVAAAVILHETGYDEIIWNKIVRLGRIAKSKVEVAVEETKEAFPETAEKLSDVKDTVVDTARTATAEAKQAAGTHDSGYDATYAPNIQKDNPPQ